MTRSNAEGKIDLASVVDAANALPEEHRRAFLAAIRECEPGILWTTNVRGRISADHIEWMEERWHLYPTNYTSFK